MTPLSREAARTKYLYKKKYQNRYWKKRAARQAGTQPQQIGTEPVSVPRNGCSDERYIAELEQSNLTLNRENRRLVKLLHDYQMMIAQSIAAVQ